MCKHLNKILPARQILFSVFGASGRKGEGKGRICIDEFPFVHTIESVIGLEHGSAIPLHVQVEKMLRDLIRKPEYQNGALLPDEVTLAMKLGISRGTIRAGIGKLVFEGLLQRKAGVGTRVAPANTWSRELARGTVLPARWRPKASRCETSCWITA